MNAAALAPYFADEAKAHEFVEGLLWPNGPTCPHCGATDRINRLGVQRTKPSKKHPEGKPVYGLWKCYHCRGQFTVRKDTIFEDSHISLSKWLMAISMMCSSKKGVSASQLQRALGLTYRSAWFMCMRVRAAMIQDPLASKLGTGGGTVEMDEVYIGGKPKNNPHRKRTKAAGKKVAVMTLVERGGRVRSHPIKSATYSEFHRAAFPYVDGAAHIVTDEHKGYRGLGIYFADHQTINHSEAYVRGILHINFAESYHSLLKRSILGTHHHISEKHLPKYLREREFHWNLRKATDGERTTAAIQGATGKRLMYKAPKA